MLFNSCVYRCSDIEIQNLIKTSVDAESKGIQPWHFCFVLFFNETLRAISVTLA